MQCPCEKNCEMRTATCHTECEKYNRYRKKLDELKKRNRRSMPIKIPNQSY